MFIKYVLIGVAVFTSVDAFASDTMEKLQDMVNDLGSDMVKLTYNNGRKIKCAQGGTKQISVRFGEKSTTYSAYYDNCKENNKVRDVVYEIETNGVEVMRDEEKLTTNRELFNAVISNDVTKVRAQLKNKADVNASYTMPLVNGGQIDGLSPLMAAASNGNLEIAKLLIKEGAWVNYLSGEIRNALWYATSTGNVGIVTYLLENGAYVNNADLSDITPLMEAAINGDTEIVRLLIRNKANLNSRHKDGDSALMFAVANGNSEIAGILIDAGADLNIRNKFGVTALIICAVENNIEVAKRLLAKKVDVTVKTDFGKTALEIASAKGHADMVQLLSAKDRVMNK